MGLFRRANKKEDSEPEAEGLKNEKGHSDEHEIDPFVLKLGWYYSESEGKYQLAKIAEADRSNHFYVIGATGTGKTKLLEYFIQQDIDIENGFGVIDPHGDLIEDIKGFLVLRYNADSLDISERVVLVDPTDPDYTVTFNPLERTPGVPAAEQANELISAFKKIWADSWGVRMEDLLRHSLIALEEAGLTLAELPRFLTDRGIRKSVLEKVNHPLALDYFKRFDSITDRSQVTWVEPIMNKLGAFFSDERIRHIFSSEKSSFNIREVMDNRKILLIKLDKGKLKDSADLLGSLLMAKIQMAAFSRSDILEKKRVPFYLYIDEFQNFAGESFAIVLSEARKYGLSLIMAHQTLAQISEELRSLILGNAGIQVYFRINRHDASLLAKEGFDYSGFEVKSYKGGSPHFWSLSEEWERYVSELQNLPPRMCYVKHKIQGGIISIKTVDIETAQASFIDIAGMSEAEYVNLIKTIPFGKKYLVSREELDRASISRRRSLEDAVREQARPVETEKPILTSKADSLPPKAVEPIIIKQPIKEPQKIIDKQVTQHRYLQSLIKKVAEDKGYKATIEQAVLDGQGKIDVALERNGKKIACEISVTSTDEQELKNIEKCLAAGYEKVILCSPDKKTLEAVKSLVTDKIGASALAKMLFLQPEELLLHLDELEAAEQGMEVRIKGYRVKVQYQATNEKEKKAKREAVAQVILQAMKRMKDKKDQ